MASVIAGKLEKDAQECFDRADAAERYGKWDCAAYARASGYEHIALAQMRRKQGEISDGRRNPR